MKNSLKLAIVAAVLVSSLSSCISDLGVTLKCGKDIDLGRLDLTDETKPYFPYTGNEKIVLKNTKGEEVTLEKFIDSAKVQTEITNIAATLCNEGIFDRQQAFYKTTRYNFLFINKGKRHPSSRRHSVESCQQCEPHRAMFRHWYWCLW